MRADGRGSGDLRPVRIEPGFVGTATTSRPNVAGRGLAPAGLFLAFVALVLVALRYFNVDTAFGDELVPTIRGWLDDFNSWLPLP